MRIKSGTFRKISILTMMSVLLFALAVHAQDVDLMELDLDALMAIEIDTVYTASKYEQKVTEAPSSISIISADIIRKYGYRDLADVLKSLRGFHVTNDRNYKYSGVRGFGLPSDYNNRILVLIDGIRHNETVYDASLIELGFPINIDNIRRIEVVRGPGSSLYGNSAFFAVVNIMTKSGKDLNGLEISADAGSFDTYQTRLTYGKTFDNGLELYVSASYLDSNGDDLYYVEFDDLSTNNGVAEDLDYERSDKILLKATYEDFTLESFYSSRKTGVPTAPWDSIFNGDLWTTDDYYTLDLKYDHTYDNELNVLARVNYNTYKYKGDYPYEGDTSIGEAPIVVNKDFAESEWVNGEIQATKSLFEKHKVTAGASLTHNLKQDQATYYVGASDWGELVDKRDSDNWAIYAQDEFTIVEGLILNAGIRYDHFQTVGGTTNPRAALIYAPNEKRTIKAIYGSAFRTPSLYELYYNDGRATQRPSPHLDPETIDTYELVFEEYVGDHLRGTIAVFFNTIDNLIQTAEDPLDICDWGDPCVYFMNVEEVEAKGIEFEIKGKWAKGYAGTINYTYQETEDKETGDELTNSPNHLAKAGLTIPVFKEKVFLSLEEQYTGKRKTLGGNEVDDFFLTNITLFSKDLFEGLETSISVYNLFDETYYDPGAGEHTQNSIEQDGTTFRFKVAYKF